MARATERSPYTCGHCPWGDHYLCVADDCACNAAGHDPDRDVVVGMMIVRRPDLAAQFRADPIVAASAWHRANERRMAGGRS